MLKGTEEEIEKSTLVPKMEESVTERGGQAIFEIDIPLESLPTWARHLMTEETTLDSGQRRDIEKGEGTMTEKIQEVEARAPMQRGPDQQTTGGIVSHRDGGRRTDESPPLGFIVAEERAGWKTTVVDEILHGITAILPWLLQSVQVGDQHQSVDPPQTLTDHPIARLEKKVESGLYHRRALRCVRLYEAVEGQQIRLSAAVRAFFVLPTLLSV